MKYIIELSDKNKYAYVNKNNILFLRETIFKKTPFGKVKTHDRHICTGINASPYYEPDCKAIEAEVWEFAQKVDAMDNYSSGRCFGGDFFPIRENGYREAKAKFEKYCKCTDDIRVGDEVRCADTNGIVVGIDTASEDSGFNVVWKDGSTSYIDKPDPIKTGRHFDEIEDILKRMKDELI